MLSVILGGVELNDPSSPWGYLEIDDIDGWWNSPAAKQDQNSRVNQDGDYPAETYYESRFITLGGALAATSASAKWAGYEMISGLLDQGERKLTINADGNTRWAIVGRNGQPEIDVVANRLIEYQMTLKATDPYKYGEPREESGAVGTAIDLFHRGNATVWPVITVTGSMPGGYELTLGGRLVEVIKPLASGSTHTIDMRTGILKENGDRAMKVFGIAEYFGIKPGAVQSFWSTPRTSGSGSVKINFNDTYI